MFSGKLFPSAGPYTEKAHLVL